LKGPSRGRTTGVLGAVLMGLLAVTAAAHAEPSLVAVIIDDLGNTRAEAERTAALPGAFTCSVLPHTPYAVLVAEACRDAGKEVFVHLPMQPEDPTARPGPGVLLIGQTRDELRDILRADLASVPGAVGVNNHMGSLLTRHVAYMDWVMAELAAREPLLFVDSATTAQSVALRVAVDYGLPTARRDVFLDEDPSPVAIRAEWARVTEIAKKQGTALAIGHPRDATLEFLATEMERVSAGDIIVVSVAELVRARDQKGQQSWQRFSSR
jgi:polysaccharide deacetylase 2 family uncharacterized protein YibQ